MANQNPFPMKGRCACNHIIYRMEAPPLIVHCCHCTYCQRETGSSFALNAMIESSYLTLLTGTLEIIKTPSFSGKGQKIARCPRCKVALWSHYSGNGELISFVRVGTLEDPGVCPPEVHIFAGSKQGWVNIGDGIGCKVKVFEEYYVREEVWKKESLERWEVLRPEVEAYKAGLTKGDVDV